MILARKTRMNLGHLVIMIDSAVGTRGFFSFRRLAIPLYSLIVIILPAVLWTSILQGFSSIKTLFIISEKHQLIRDKIINDLGRGGTYIKAEACMRGNDRTIIYTNLNRRELAILQEFIHRTDPDAFMTVINANEVLGRDSVP